MRFRQLRESDHAAVIAVVDGWWGGRPVADKLPHLFFRLSRETSLAVEENGEIFAFLVGIVGSPDEEAYVHFVGVHPKHRSGSGAGCTRSFSRRPVAGGDGPVRAITPRSTWGPSPFTVGRVSR